MRTVTHRQFTRFVIAITVVLAAVILLTCLLYTMVILQRNQDYVDGILARYQESLSTQMEEYTQLVQTFHIPGIIFMFPDLYAGFIHNILFFI